MSDYKRIIVNLINSEISGYRIYMETGISQTVISTLRNGTRDIDNLTLKTTEKLYEYAKNYSESDTQSSN